MVCGVVVMVIGAVFKLLNVTRTTSASFFKMLIHVYTCMNNTCQKKLINQLRKFTQWKMEKARKVMLCESDATNIIYTSVTPCKL